MKYTDQQLTFVHTFLEESGRTGDYKTAKKNALIAAGYAESTKVQDVIAGVKDLLVEQVGLELLQKIPKLLFKLEDIVDNPSTPGAKRVLEACTILLDRAGIVKKEQQEVTIKAPDGVLILPSKKLINNE